MIPRLLHERHLLAVCLLMASLLLSGLLVAGGLSAITHAQTEEAPTGNMVVVPDSLVVGDTAEVVAFDVEPAELEVYFEYSEHFVVEGESCGTEEVGITASVPSPTWIPLTACVAGQGRIRLLGADSGSAIAELSATIVEAPAEEEDDGPSGEEGDDVEGAQQGCGIMFEQPCPPAPSIDYEFSPKSGSRTYNITISWGGRGYDMYRLSGDLGSYTGTASSRRVSRPCGRSYDVSVTARGDNVDFAPIWSPSSSTTVTTPDCPTSTPPPTPRPTPTPTNRSPEFSSSSTTRSVAENTASDTDIGSPVTATDPDGDDLEYSIGGTDASSFGIEESTGQLSTDADLDHETKSSYSVTVTAEDPSGDSDSIRVTITVTDVNERPVVSGDSSADYSENGTSSVASYSATDDDGDSITWSLPNTTFEKDRRDFDISSSGVLTFEETPDYEDPDDSNNDNEYRVTVMASDGSLTESIDVTVTVINVDETGSIELSPTTTPQVGTEIAASLTDPDGGVRRTSWRWQAKTLERSDGTLDWQNIPSATSARYTPVLGNAGHPLGVTVGYTDNHGSGKSATSAATKDVSLPKLAAPTNLAVTPMSLRRAELTWDTVPNADGYEVRVNDSGRHGTINTSESRYIVNLDNILDPKGLAHEEYFEFQVKGKNSKGTHSESEYSVKVRIVDNPVLTTGSAKRPSTGNVWVELQWDRISDVTRYTVRSRTLGIQIKNNGREIKRLHKDVDWPKDAQWPHYSDDSSETSVSQPSGSLVSLQLSRAKPDFLYAFQVNYELDEGSEPGADVEPLKVFSARDAYAWTSYNFPGNDERVGTYPFFGHHARRTFEYHICKNSFPLADRSTWVSIIDDAFKTWQDATDGFITMRKLSENCPPASNMEQFVKQDDERNEVRMLDPQEGAGTWSFPEVKSDIFKGFCVPRGPACTTSFTGYTGIGHDHDVRRQILSALEDDYLTPTEFLSIWADLTARVRKASNVIQSADVTFNFRDKGNPRFVATRDLGRPNSVDFNTCTPERDGQDPDMGYKAFRLAVHEAGHALGLSNISLLQVWQPYHIAHPTIPDAAMNYDKESIHLYDPRLDDPKTKGINEGWKRREPDCSPHPFDVMAIHALYQTVPK